ncbi:hypothetical protein ACLOJK_018985 [Asimina triloba]
MAGSPHRGPSGRLPGGEALHLTSIKLGGKTLVLGGHLRFESYVGGVEVSRLNWTMSMVVDDIGWLWMVMYDRVEDMDQPSSRT